MNEEQYAKQILEILNNAKNQLANNQNDGISLCRPIDILQKLNLEFNKLKTETEKLGFYVNYSKNINSKWWQKQPNRLIFYFNEADL